LIFDEALNVFSAHLMVENVFYNWADLVDFLHGVLAEGEPLPFEETSAEASTREVTER
jgi:hypothetical protein